MTSTRPRDAATLPPVTLTPEEAAAIAVALAARADGMYADDGRAALDKVLAALEPDPRRREALVASSLLVREQSARMADGRQAVEQALALHQVVVLAYRDGKGAASRREVEPQLLARAADHEYLVAWCRERQAMRWFRWDRIEGAELTGERAPRRNLTDYGTPPGGAHPTHPAGRARATASATPRLVLLPGGRR
jgi:predicted DNA-binding transcriptional regulator YafY